MICFPQFSVQCWPNLGKNNRSSKALFALKNTKLLKNVRALPRGAAEKPACGGQEMFLRTGISPVPVMRALPWTSFCHRNCVPSADTMGLYMVGGLELANPSTLQPNNAKSQSYLSLPPSPKFFHKCETC